MKPWMGIGLVGLLGFVGTAVADEEALLAELDPSNPVGRQMLSADDYLHYTPSQERLTGRFVTAYSGTSALWLEAVLGKLAQQHPSANWTSKEHFYASPGVLQVVSEGLVRVGVSSWPMTSAQREEFVRRFGYPVLEARVALDAIQILAHPDNPIEQITVPQLDAIYGTELRAGELKPIHRWDQLGVSAWGAADIKAYACTLYYGTSQFFQEAVLVGGPWREGLPVLGDVSTTPEYLVAQNPRSLAYSNYRPRGDGVKVLPVARQTGERAFAPLPRHIYSEEYPLTRFFYVYVNAPSVKDVPPEIREFLNYVLSFEGQYEVARSGSLPLDRTMLLRARKRMGLPVFSTP